MKKPRSGKASREVGPVPAQAGVSLLVHDLKNLAGRLGMLHQNLDTHYADPKFKGTALRLLGDTVMHLKRLAGDVYEHEDRVLIKLRVDLNQILADALQEVRPDLAVAVNLVESYDPIPAIWGDGYLLRRAFACAIENAIQAMKGRGDLLVRSGVARRAGRARAFVDVEDSGPGMSLEFVRDRLFQPFTTTKGDGHGLGVYTIRQVAMLHGGSVRIKSVEGVGTRVRFHFPIDED